MSIQHPGPDLPLALCRHYKLPHQIEYSFKLTAGLPPLTNRYVIGIPAKKISDAQLTLISQELGMPAPYAANGMSIEAYRNEATTIYLGHEEHPSGNSYRLYFEFWDQICNRLRSVPAQELEKWTDPTKPLWTMMIGYKWPESGSGKLRKTVYRVRPLLNAREIQARVFTYTQSTVASPEFSNLMCHLTQRLLDVSPNQPPVFLDVSEASGSRQSFDLCCHKYKVRINAYREAIESLSATITRSRQSLEDCLKARNPASWLTHISAGCSHDGTPFASFYYDPSPK